MIVIRAVGVCVVYKGIIKCRSVSEEKKEKEVRVAIKGNFDLFFCRIRLLNSIYYSGCRSPPTFDLKNSN